MIKVKIISKEKSIKKIEVRDHAYYDIEGFDIVCSAVSIMIFNTIDTFTDLLNLRDKIKYSIEEELISLEINDDMTDQEYRDSQLILRKFELAMKSIKNEYSEYIDIAYTEV